MVSHSSILFSRHFSSRTASFPGVFHYPGHGCFHCSCSLLSQGFTVLSISMVRVPFTSNQWESHYWTSYRPCISFSESKLCLESGEGFSWWRLKKRSSLAWELFKCLIWWETFSLQEGFVLLSPKQWSEFNDKSHSHAGYSGNPSPNMKVLQYSLKMVRIWVCLHFGNFQPQNRISHICLSFLVKQVQLQN